MKSQESRGISPFLSTISRQIIAVIPSRWLAHMRIFQEPGRISSLNIKGFNSIDLTLSLAFPARDSSGISGQQKISGTEQISQPQTDISWR